ncbi:hypothetical protein FALCPG4_000193 [Fusarium falciforme]
MLSRAAVRTTTSLVTKRGFQTTRARLSSPYHYPEGAYSNIPFNPRSKWFGVGFWTFMATGFFAPFGISGAWFLSRALPAGGIDANSPCSLADLQAYLSPWLADWVCCSSIDRSGSLWMDRCVHNRNRQQSLSILVLEIFHLSDQQFCLCVICNVIYAHDQLNSCSCLIRESSKYTELSALGYALIWRNIQIGTEYTVTS